MTVRLFSICLFLLVFSASFTRQEFLASPEENEVSDKLSDVEEREYVEKKFVPKLLSYIFSVLDVDQVVKDVKYGQVSSGTCSTCKFGVGMLQHYIKTGKGQKEIAKTAVSICKSLNYFTNRVCEGVISLFQDQVVYVLERSFLTSDEICGFILGANCAEVINPFHNWTVPTSSIPKPPVRPTPLPKPGSPVIKVLQLSDIHFDPYYTEGSNAVCREPLCCRLGDGPAPTPENAAGKWGDYRDCDTPLRTLESVLRHISSTQNIDYIIWTGDSPPHDIWNSTKLQNLYEIRVTTQLIKKYFPSTPVIPCMGNHESVPVNSFPLPDAPEEYSISWLYDNVASYWKDWLSDEAMETFIKGGYFSMKVHPGLRIISINNNYCNGLNWWLLLNSTDPVQQLHWLVEQLQDAEDNNEKVQIIGHIPPGQYDCLQVWSRNFYSIISRYENTVTAQFYGHTHYDEFEIFYDEATLKRAINIAYIAPSVTTFGGVNPSFRIYTVDGNYAGTTYAILDHETHFMNLTYANLYDEPIWRKEYSAKEEYNLSSLNPSEWDNLVKQFETNNNLFERYYRLHFVESDFSRKECTEVCKAEKICQLKTGRSNDPVFCMPTATQIK